MVPSLFELLKFYCMTYCSKAVLSPRISSTSSLTNSCMLGCLARACKVHMMADPVVSWPVNLIYDIKHVTQNLVNNFIMENSSNTEMRNEITVLTVFTMTRQHQLK